MIGCGCEVCRSQDPRDHRLRSSAMVESHKTRIIVDCGPDFRYQMLREGVDRIDAILLTHEHTDHIIGMDDVRAYNYFQRQSVPIYCTDRVARVVRKDFDYAFTEERYPGAPEISLRSVDHEPFEIGDLRIVPIRGNHYLLPVTGYRIGDVAYLTDFNSIADAEVEKLKGLKVFIINALREQKHISHFSLSEAIELARRVGAEQTLFTHMSHQIGLYANENPKLPEGMAFAYDGLKIEI